MAFPHFMAHVIVCVCVQVWVLCKSFWVSDVQRKPWNVVCSKRTSVVDVDDVKGESFATSFDTQIQPKEEKKTNQPTRSVTKCPTLVDFRRRIKRETKAEYVLYIIELANLLG